ncbi:unnamed protein product [Mycena citricolor]|uniref:Zn(2)-C6 fungal-type domain-containing protein n=1 Tax=Mycena citricolor TaxID=2018698 RepID=A0AAD2H4A4_9AGAR|nr:unnamed protein product [Mycena citricolor]
MDPSAHDKAHLRRGKACYHCRIRKTRCDGALPSCGPCVRAGCEDDCEYLHIGEKARVQIIEERILEVEAKIRRYTKGKRQSTLKGKEKARAASPSASSSSSSSASLSTATSASSRSSSSMLSSPSTSSSVSSLQSQSPASLSPTCPSPCLSPDLTGSVPPEAFATVIPLDVIHLFSDTFYDHATDFGFFLDEAVIQFRPAGDRPSCMSPALTATIYLLSAHLSAHPSVAKLESFLLKTACNLLPKELATPGANVAEILQAELLLAQYFFALGRNTEARFHMSVGSGIAFGCGLPDKVCPGLDAIRSRAAYLFLLSLDNAWSAALGYTPHKPLSAVLHGSNCDVMNSMWTMSGFPGQPVLVTKSVTLWQGVEALITTPMPFGDLLERSENLEKLIQLWLLELDYYETETRDTGALSRVLLFAGTVTHYAFMKLRRLLWARETPEDHLHSACAILRKIIAAVEKGQITYLNPLMGKIWYGVYELVSHEIRQRGPLGEDTAELAMTLRSGLVAISSLSDTCCFAREFSVLHVPS